MSSSNFSGARKAMIDSQLRTSGINSAWVIAAMGRTAREDFVPDSRRDIAYMDRTIPLTNGRVLNPPLATGLILQEADIQPSDKVLLIGGGSGYMAKLLSDHVASLVVVESDEALMAQAQKNLGSAENVHFVSGDLAQGAADKGPYSVILIDGGVAQLPDMLVDQLADGGRIVAGMMDASVSRIGYGVKRGGKVALQSFADCSIAPLPGFERAEEFTF
ncbi:protein-L-isoaspartate O-methyltransferase [Sphingorhabdus arenilitoris]|uniref:Protein-L-isoaspartate O-methyltransferase n=1 Tax=Sphingorhabdus arenilitoris TaxID=1490041 RepID=A0ABV8RDL3_9SPHN